MATDAFGNDVAAVGVPVTGFLGFAPAGTTFPTPSGGAATTLTLDPAFKKAGLLTEDGGFEWTKEADGDPIVFWQDGYSIPTGLANCTLVAKLAQYNETIRTLISGKTADGNGYIQIDASGNTNHYVLFTEEIYKNGVIVRTVAADAYISGVTVDKSERGTVRGYEVTFTVNRSSLLANNHIGEWLIPASAGTVAVVTAATSTPSAQVAGGSVVITGTGFTGATGVKFGATNANMFVVNSDTQITAIMPPGSAGTANVQVVNAAGNSNSFAYTRGA